MALVLSTNMQDFVLSTNPPNPKTSFRLGDWICASPKCAAHNFGRNLSCIGCGSQRSPSSPTNPPRPAISSPRFTLSPTPPPPPPNFPSDNNLKPSPHHPLLTPSGRAFAIGGKVQNISSDPLNPCIMFWPDNEPFPDQGQIRPSGLVGISPPILNTGNRGPISHQPGDWVCQKCNYLNWRRRKVCQTCLPYAEGNGDSISAAVQAERIALLTNVLSRTRLDLNRNFQGPVNEQIGPSTCPLTAQRSHSLTPPTERTGLGSAPAFLEFSPSPALNLLRPTVAQSGLNKPVQRSRSHIALGQQYQLQQDHYQGQIQRHLAPTPIYQTPLPSPCAPRFGPELTTPPQQQLFQHHPQMRRNPSPLPMPLLYSTGPPASPFLGAGLSAGYRMRVLSSPAPPVHLNWNPRDPVSSPRASGSGSISSLGSLEVRIGENEEYSAAGKKMDENEIGSGSGSELPTPAITSPLLPAFLRDVVSKNGSVSGEETEVLSGSPKALEGADLSREDAFAEISKTPSPVPGFHSRGATFPLSTLTPATKPASQIISRARNDSGSSTSSSSSSLISLTSSNVSTSLSATSLSSGGGSSMRSARALGPRSSSSSSSSPTVTTTVSSCPTPPADKGSSTAPAVPTSTSSLPFMSFGAGGIWKMDGEESRSLKIPPPPPPPPPAQASANRHNGFGVVGGQRHGHHLHELQAPLLLPVGAEKRLC